MSDHLDHLGRRIGDELERHLADVGRAPGDLGAVTRRSARLRRRRRTTIVAAAALAVGLAAATAVLAVRHDDRGVDPATPVGGTWTEVARSPLAPVAGAIAAWTGDEVVVIGGDTEPPCPPNADCVAPDTYTGAAAAYDPAADTWRKLADAPVGVGSGFLLYAADDRLVLTDGAYGYGKTWFGYDFATDRWSPLPRPPVRVVAPGGVLDGELYELGRDGSLVVLDPAAGTWRTVPGSTVRPTLDPSSSLTVTDEGIFVTGTDPTEPDVHDAPHYVYVDRLEGGRWTRYPQTGQIGSGWTWTGQRLVAFAPSVATGLTGTPPYGGVLDVDTGAWSLLPNAPDLESGEGYDDDSWSVNAAGGPVILGWSSVYDDRTGTWTPQGRPAGTTVDTDQAAVWADGRLVVVGGLDTETGYTDVSGLSNQAWIWTPAG